MIGNVEVVEESTVDEGIGTKARFIANDIIFAFMTSSVLKRCIYHVIFQLEPLIG